MRTREEVYKDLFSIEKQAAVLQKKRADCYSELKEIDRSGVEWLSVKEASERAKCSQFTIRRLINDNRLKVRRIGARLYVKQSEVDALNDEAYGF